MRTYTQLTQEQWHQVYTLMKVALNQPEIATLVGVHKSTISGRYGLTVAWGGTGRNEPINGHCIAARQKLGRAFVMRTGVYWNVCCARTGVPSTSASGWPRNIICPSATKGSTSTCWSTSAVANLNRHLRCEKPRKKRCGTDDCRDQLRNRISIDDCPAIVEHRCRIGDWELNTIIGKDHKQAIVSLAERKSRLALIA